ncbi:MAG: aspartate ammonia-lyase, partial [Porticoccaceae bacterium]|nr:aspartate ammonia-lyase [Porticoccaceae bacterium]
MKTRIERDSMGELEVPEAALYGAQTQRAINNFPVSGKTMPEAFIRALLTAKSAAAQANANLELLPSNVANAISEVVTELLESPNLMNHFPVDVYQTGSGTSSNMNANEVLATLASAKVGEAVSANDHINYGQSSNDIIPSCIHISTAIEVTEQLLPALEHLHDAIVSKAKSVDHHIKTGRTHLMDAMPVRLSQSLLSWATQVEQNIYFIKAILPKLQTLAQGGTAVGTGINAHPGFAVEFNKQLSAVTGIEFSPADNLFTHINTQDVIVSLSGQLKTTAVSIMKIANDLRW